ncbi:hypothetical protein HYQ46_002602 [Verticillium longisporum]|nr:hypothetical protein HYQ46_002602 [Verticillium longisporum]
MSAPSDEQLNRIAADAEADLNSYQAKTGEAREQADDAAGVRSIPENKFPGADEGGDLDARGRQARGELYDHNKGDGGPAAALDANEPSGANDGDVYRIPGIDSLGTQGQKHDPLLQGEDASITNVGRNPPGPGGSKFKGEGYYKPESVPGSIAAEGNVPPASVTEASRETEGY